MNLNQISLSLLLIFCLTSPTPLHADIATDGSVGSAKSLTGPDYAIPETLGTVKGNNLFHSFEKFSIKTQESATFTGSDSIKNVISRVTGGEKSEIDGTLRSNVGKADFYFINPSGVVFGQNAKVDVPAAFHVSTSDELKFADGAYFKASKSETSTLTQAAPEAFGFLGTQSASIEVNGSTLEFKPESKISLTSSKDITIKGQEDNQSYLFSKGGEIELKANGDLPMDNAAVVTRGNGGGKISVKSSNMRLKNKSYILADNTGDKNSIGGVDVYVNKDLDLVNGSRITSDALSKGDAGNVKMNAGNMKIDKQGSTNFTGVSSSASTGSEGKAGTVEITVAEYLELLNGGEISSSTFSKGNAGGVSVNAGDMKVDGQGYYAGVFSSADIGSEGNGGTIEIKVTGLLELLNGAVIATSTFAQGNAGETIVKAGKIKMDGQGYYVGIFSNAERGSQGNANTINITVENQFELINGARISSSTWSKGDAGNVKINANNMKIDGQVSSNFTGVASNASTGSEGNAGKVEITITEFLEVLNSAQILSSTFSKGDAGYVIVKAKNMKVDGQGNNNYFTLISSSAETESEGNAGEVNITVDDLLEVLNGAQILSTTFSKGNAGSVIVNSGNIRIYGEGNNNFTGISSSADKGSRGNAGKIEITVKELLELCNIGAGIESVTFSSGDAGSVTINARHIRIDGQRRSDESSYFTGIASSVPSDAAALAGCVGKILVNADSMTLLNYARISIGAFQTISEEKLANMNDKSITLNTKQLNIESGSRITSESTENAPASDININSDIIYLHDGLITTSVLGTNGDGGNISINEESDPAGFLVMQNGLIQANTSAGGAKGGRIRINADNLIADKSMPFQIGEEPEVFSLDDKKNIIQAADPSKNPQDIEVPEVSVDLSGQIMNVGLGFSEPVKMAENQCRLVGTKRASSLTQGGKGGIPESSLQPSSISFGGKRLDDLLMYGENQ